MEPTTSDGSNSVGHLYGWQPLIAGLPARVSDEFQKQATSTSLSLTEEEV